MAEETAQAQDEPKFRGMDNMTLIPFSTKAAVTSSDTRVGSDNIKLPNATANTLLSSQITTTGNAHVYTDVSVPVGVSSFLFYGKAVDATAGTDASSAEDMFKYGSLTATGLSDGAPSGISFSPKQIYSTGSADAKATSIANYLTTIAGSSYTDGSSTEHKWSAVSADAQGQGSALATLYKNFTSLTAGSSASVQQAVQELYTSLNSLLSGNHNQTDVNKEIINKIIENIKTGATVADGTGVVTLNSDYTGFPANINLPDGAATVKFADSKFTAQTPQALRSQLCQIMYILPTSGIVPTLLSRLLTRC